MKRFLQSLLLLVPAISSYTSAEQFNIGQLQGAWWAQDPGPTAAFAIQGNEVWYDYDSKYHPVKVENDILVVDHGPELGIVKSRIISVGNGRLVLQGVTYPSRAEAYTLAEPHP